MKILFIHPIEKFNYKAPVIPLGLISIATYLKNGGHEVKIVNRCFEHKKIKKIIFEFVPDIVGIFGS